MKLILPETHPILDDFRDAHMFFLAGPIQGGDDWQRRAAEMIDRKTEGNCIIVNPCRYGPEHPHFNYRLGGPEDMFSSQTLWERFYLERAGEGWPRGCIIFWLPEESETNPRNDGDPYATDTRGEIGEWRYRASINNARVVMGAEPGFPRLDAIRKNNLGIAPDRLPIYSSLEETVYEAIRRAYR